MLINEIFYYIGRRGNALVEDWINDRDNANIRDNIDARITMLGMAGLELLGNPRILEPIEPMGKKGSRVPGFYELKSTAQKWRIAVYHDLHDKCFVLLYGFRKYQPKQPREIERAYGLLNEYLSRKVQNNVKIIYQRPN